MKFVFVDRKGAVSIWSLIAPLAADLVKDGHVVAFARLDDGSDQPSTPVPAGVLVHDLAVPAKKPIIRSLPQHVVFASRFHSLIRDVAPDVVHTNFCVPGVAARAVARLRRVPRIVSTQHELYGSMNPLYRLAVRLTEYQADAIVYVSAAVARSFGRTPDALARPQLSGRGPRHVVIHNGVDTQVLEDVRRRAGPIEKGKLVCVGRLIDVKGQRLLIEALPAVLRERPDVRLVLAGRGPDETYLRTVTAATGLVDKVLFQGWLSHREGLHEMATAEAVVLPSLPRQEGFGLVLVEAMGLGVPVIASRIPVFQEVAGEASRNVRFFEPGSPSALAQALADTLSRPPGERAPDQRVESAFPISRMVEKYRSLYEVLNSEERRPARVARRRVPALRAPPAEEDQS